MAEQTFNNMSMVAGIHRVVADHRVGSDQRRCVHDIDAALSLSALCRLTCNETPPRDERPLSNEIESFHPVSIKLPTPTMDERTDVVTHIVQSLVGQSMVQDLTPGCSTLSLDIPQHPVGEPNRYNILALLPKKPQGAKHLKVAANATSRKNNTKPKDPKRDTSISFEEMKRLMRVYGPIKALRNRTSKDTGKAAKPESIRRKFYRWFPDFHERFVKTSDGWSTPKAGHQQEMQYRESMRKMDQELLVKKRNDKRYSCGMIGQNGKYAQTLYY
mmetsp:Transcript_11749/g.21727  ORF Transcript_11749/g.21727 Transcript_11749/m.21727 type:complete len:273 (+) Transcript_11749:108-926(+)